jgi:hypothetical protein
VSWFLTLPVGPDDTRSGGQRNADALVELAATCCTAQLLPTQVGQRPHQNLTITLSELTDLSPRAWQRRIACDAVTTTEPSTNTTGASTPTNTPTPSPSPDRAANNWCRRARPERRARRRVGPQTGAAM